MSNRTRFLFLAITAAAAAADAPAQPVFREGEFQINTYTTHCQASPRVAAGPSGDFVVAWTGYGDQDGNELGIFGQRFDSSGGSLGDELQINSYTTGRQLIPAVTETAGGFVVAWMGPGNGGDYDVFGQRFDAAGNRLGMNFQVNSYTTGNQGGPTLAPAADGGFVVVWRSSTQGALLARRFDAGGSAGEELAVVTNASVDHQRVAALGGGEFVVVWTDWDDPDGHYSGILGQRLDSAGQTIGDSFQVNTTTLGYQYYLAVDGTAEDGFIVAWTDDGSTHGTAPFIFGQRFDAAGSFSGAEFQVNTATSFSMITPEVAVRESGDFIVTWRSFGQDGSDDGVFGQLFDSTGAFAGSEFQLNTYTTGRQDLPSLALGQDGEFVAVWLSFEQDGDSCGVFGQRLALPAIFEDGFESGDTSAWSAATP